MNLAELSLLYQQELKELYDVEEVQTLYLMVVEYVLGYGKATHILKKQELISDVDHLKFKEILKELSIGKPIQYVFSEAAFYGLKFKVNPWVLIPRPETEELVAWILSACNTQSPNPNLKSNVKILDIGTGSGCIAITLKKSWAAAHVSALDISAEALATAKENAELNQVEVDFIEADILDHSIVQAFDHSKFDLIVSNPPYIKENEQSAMHRNVIAHEPHTALFVSNENPLIFYEAVANFAVSNLKENGFLFFEINEYLGIETVKLLKSKGFTNVELRRDMQGKDRMICAIR